MTGLRLIVSLAAIVALLARSGGFAASCSTLLACAPAAAQVDQGAPRQGVQVLFGFHNANLQEALPEFGRLLDLGSVRVDPEVRGTLTIESSSPVSREDAFQLFLRVLRDHKAVLVQTTEPTKIYTVVPAAQGLPRHSELVTDLPPAFPGPYSSTVPGVESPTREPLRVGGNIQELKLIKKVAPVYPEPATRMRVARPLLLRVLLNELGEVANVRIYGGGHPLLQLPAVEAVKQWRYSPTYVNGEAVPVITTVRIDFDPRNPQRLPSH
ncbi:MAG: energy transducer TonB [Acidobacteriia bacterium]|nr:energy transducer TonB [Terriglobia bacterium]